MKDREICAKEAAHIFESLAIFRASKNIACYLATPNEFDTTPIIECIWKYKKACFIPVLPEPHDKLLLFSQYRYGDVLHPNVFNILEPLNHTHMIAPSALDLVIVPLIAFDRKGNRLGTGGGYYDKTFAFLTENEKREPYLLGLGYANQEANDLAKDPWDIKLNGVLTEREFVGLG